MSTGIGRTVCRGRGPWVWGAMALGAACDGPATSTPDYPEDVVGDSAGIEIVQNGAPVWGPRDAWSIDPEPLLQMGAIEGEELYQFEHVAQVERLDDGRFLLVEGRRLEIRLYDADGTHLVSMGREGEGPGEFRFAPRVLFLPPDTILAWNASLRRMSRFTTDGTLIDDVRMTADLQGLGFRPPGVGSRWGVARSGVMFTSESSVIATAAGTPLRVVNSEIGLGFVHDFGERLVPLGAFPSGQTARGFGRDQGSASNPFAARTYHAFERDVARLHLVHSWYWEVRRLSPEARVEQIARIPRQRRPVTAEWLNEREELIVASAREVGNDPSANVRAWRMLSFPDSAPAISAIHLDTEGNRFARRWVEDRSLQPDSFEVISPEGRWLGSMEISQELGSIQQIGEDFLVTSWFDEFEVPYVRMYRISKPTG